MDLLDYIRVPPCATRIAAQNIPVSTHTSPSKVRARSLSPQSRADSFATLSTSAGASKSNSITSVLLSLPSSIPAVPVNAAQPRRTSTRLLSTRDPLSLPITTANFRRFVGRSGVIWWMQDRVEEIVMWRRGWKWTACWMAGYAFICYYPHLFLLLPQVVLLAIILYSLSDQPSVSVTSSGSGSTPIPVPPPEGSIAWQANIQAIQNLMGIVADVYEFVVPLISPFLSQTNRHPLTTPLLLSILTFSVFMCFLPLRPTLLVVGLAPFAFTHPYVLLRLPQLVHHIFTPRIRQRLQRAADDDAFDDLMVVRNQSGWLREVELYENERWGSAEGGKRECWGKGNIRVGERKPWTRGRDGWSGVGKDGQADVSVLTFPLPIGWSYLPSETWRPDLEALWAGVGGGDDDGWVYTNDDWLDPSPVPREQDWKQTGMTRRRRWVRRIYWDDAEVKADTRQVKEVSRG